jgi:hypothetical protein
MLQHQHQHRMFTGDTHYIHTSSGHMNIVTVQFQQVNLNLYLHTDRSQSDAIEQIALADLLRDFLHSLRCVHIV